MSLYKNKYRIESTRLPNYDFSKPGSYFITIVTYDRQCLFGKILNGKMDLNDAGQIVNTCWLEIPNHFPHALLDEFVIMPNHIHGIIIINEMYKKSNETNFNANVGNIIVETKNFSSLQLKNDTLINDKLNQNKNKQPRGTSKTIGSMVRGFKIGVTKWFRQNTRIHDVWQRNYYEHIIRNKNEFNIIRHYINNNLLNWKNDSNYSS